MPALGTLVYIYFLRVALADKIFFGLSVAVFDSREGRAVGQNSIAFVSVCLKLLNFPVVLETNCLWQRTGVHATVSYAPCKHASNLIT